MNALMMLLLGGHWRYESQYHRIEDEPLVVLVRCTCGATLDFTLEPVA